LSLLFATAFQRDTDSVVDVMLLAAKVGASYAKTTSSPMEKNTCEEDYSAEPTHGILMRASQVLALTRSETHAQVRTASRFATVDQCGLVQDARMGSTKFGTVDQTGLVDKGCRTTRGNAKFATVVQSGAVQGGRRKNNNDFSVQKV
jgi:hypothetical protein